MVELLAIGGAAALFGGIMAAIASGSSRKESSNQQENNQNNINNAQSILPLNTPYEAKSYDYTRINMNHFDNNINSFNQTNYTSYGGYGGYYQNQNYGNFGLYGYNHNYGNSNNYGYGKNINNNYYQQPINNINNKIKSIPVYNQPYLHRRSPEKKNKYNIYQIDLVKPIQKRHLSPKGYNIGRIINVSNGENKINEAKKIDWKKKLGHGGFGEVYQIEYKGFKYAGKKIPKSIFTEEKMKIAFEREISIMIKMNGYENSVKFYKNLEDEVYQILILELCDDDLQHYIDNTVGGLNENKIRSIMRQLNNIFKIFYEENIIHRDIKPANILIKYTDFNKTNFIVKMNDYGLSRISKEATTVWGTPFYCAPEISSRKPYNHKVDLWSVGAMIYYMHFKNYPFGFNSVPFGKKEKNASNYYLDDLLNKLLVCNPEYRLSWPEYYHPFFKCY